MGGRTGHGRFEGAGRSAGGRSSNSGGGEVTDDKKEGTVWDFWSDLQVGWVKGRC